MLRRLILICSLVFLGASLIGCGGGGDSTKNSNYGMVSVSLSDPPTCSASTGGPFQSVYVTIADIQIHRSSSASDNDTGWVDLTPGLKSAPRQVDLLGLANPQCFLTTFGATPLDAGSYQQIRIILAENNVTPANDKCGGVGPHCVVLANDLLNPKRLELSSEARNGIKIPSGQIAGGAFTIAAGQTKDLNLDFNTCSSIISQRSGTYRLKPVLHAGEVALNSTPVSGQLVDAATNQPIANSKGVVLLEKRDSNGVGRVVMQTVPDANGTFSFCPVVGEGPYDIVAVAVDANATKAYGPTVLTGVRPGANVGKLPLTALSGAASTAPARLTGQITTGNTTVDAEISALHQISAGGTTYPVTIPLALQATGTTKATTATGGTCPSGTACVNYELAVPALNATVGTWSGSSATYTVGATGAVNYLVDAITTTPGSVSQPTCNPSRQTTQAIPVTAGTVTNVPAIAFASCSSQ